MVHRNPLSRRGRLRRFAALTALLLYAASPGSLAAQQPPLAAGQELNAVNFQVDGPTQRLEMIVRTSRILTLNTRVPRMLVNNTEIVRATPLSPTQIQVSALRPGVTQVNLWDDDGQIHTVDVVVMGDARELELLLRSEFPEAAIRVRPTANAVVLSGYVPRPEMVRQIVVMSEDYFPRVINNLRVGGVQQVLLHVKIVEVSRTKMRALGVDWAMVGDGEFVIQSASQVLSALSNDFGVVSQGADSVRFGIMGTDTSFYGFIEALRQNNLAKLLAEPTLVTISGRPASFNVGGEVPIQIASATGTPGVEFREFGTRVDFVPIVLGNGIIRLECRPAVSEVDPSLSVAGTPGFRSRWVDTAVEMKAGQTLALAGLIQNRTDTSNRGIPLLADLPWVGAAFRRVEERNNEIELVVMVTPELVDALDPHQVPHCLPGQATHSPSDAELYGRGYLEVPNCCLDGSCPGCRAGNHGGPAALRYEEVPAGPAAPAPGTGARRPAPAGPAGRTSPAGASAVTVSRPAEPAQAVQLLQPARVNPSTATTAPSAGRGPLMIGPTGYDVLD